MSLNVAENGMVLAFEVSPRLSLSQSAYLDKKFKVATLSAGLSAAGKACTLTT